jgi:hypothetical protein
MASCQTSARPTFDQRWGLTTTPRSRPALVLDHGLIDCVSVFAVTPSDSERPAIGRCGRAAYEKYTAVSE